MIRVILTKEQFDEEQNRLKYSGIHGDLISQKFAFSNERGVNFCIDNIERYAKRFKTDAIKANNEADIFKMQDYINRAIAHNKNKSFEKLLAEIQEAIKERKFSIVLDKCFYVGSKCFNP